MKFKISTAEFAGALGDVQLPAAKIGVAGTALVLLEAGEGRLSITASDLEVTVARNISAQVSRSGECAVNSRRLLGISKSLPAQEAEVRTNQDGAKLGIFAGSAKATLVTAGSDEFPKHSDKGPAAWFMIGSTPLRKNLERVHYAVATEGTRYVCMGVCVDVDGGVVKFAATDAKRVSVSEERVKGEGSFKVIVPSRAVERLMKILPRDERVQVSLGGGFIRFAWESGRLETKLIEGEFPNYAALLPQSRERTAAEVNREPLLGAVRRAVGAGGGERIVSLFFRAATVADKGFLGDAGGAIVVSLPESGEGSYSEVVPLDIAPEKDGKVSFLSDYLTEPLSAGEGKTLTLRYGGEEEIAFLEQPGEFLSIIAPVRPL